MDNYILAYYQGIQNGSIVVGKWIRKLYTKIVRGIEDGTYLFNQKKANNAISFIEKFCHHNKGKLAPGRITLDLWQKAFISCLFGIVDPNGNRHFREVVLVVGRKCGKTLLAAAIMTYMVSSVPLTVFINADGEVVTNRVGAMSGEVLQSYIDLITG